MNKIVDCFMFYNEIDMLKFRLKHLNEVVDYFIIAEATVSHQNTPRSLIFDSLKSELEPYLHKIIYVAVDDMPGGNKSSDNWLREKHQRKALSRGLEKLDLKDQDILLLSCCDEIPNNELIQQIKINGLNIFNSDSNLKYKPFHTNVEDYDKGISLFYMDMYWYNLTTKSNYGWTLSRACTVNKLKELGGFQEFIENKTKTYYIKGGWHFTFFGNKDFITTKIKSFAHDEYNKPEYLNEKEITDRIQNQKDLFGRPHEKFYNIEIQDNTFLPFNYLDIITNENFKN